MKATIAGYLLGMCAVLAFCVPASATKTSYPMELTNKTAVTIQGIRFSSSRTPEAAGEKPMTPVTVKTAVAPGAKAVIARPVGDPDANYGDVLEVVLVSDKATFTFPVVSYFQMENTEVTLTLEGNTQVPELCFYEPGTENWLSVVAGNNTAWGIAKPILNCFPYAPGVTTVDQAVKWGAKPGAGKTYTVKQTWDSEPWTVLLYFDGNTPESKLVAYTMTMKRNNTEEDRDYSFDQYLTINGYVSVNDLLQEAVDNENPAERLDEATATKLQAVFYSAAKGNDASLVYIDKAVYDRLRAANTNGSSRTDAVKGALVCVLEELESKNATTYRISLMPFELMKRVLDTK